MLVAVPEPEGLASAPDTKSREGAWPGRAHHALPAHQHPDTHGEYPLPVPGSWRWAPGGGTLPAAPWRLPPGQRLRVPGRGSRLGHASRGRRAGRLELGPCLDPGTRELRQPGPSCAGNGGHVLASPASQEFRVPAVRVLPACGRSKPLRGTQKVLLSQVQHPLPYTEPLRRAVRGGRSGLTQGKEV